MQFSRRFTLLLVLIGTIVACGGDNEVRPAPEYREQTDKQLRLGIRRFNNNDYAGANAYFQKALHRYRGIDDRVGMANSCLNLAKTALAGNHHAQAAHYLQQAENAIDEADSRQAKQLQLLKASLALKTGDPASAARLSETLTEDDNMSVRLAALQLRTAAALAQNADDISSWLEAYKKLQQATADTESHHARWLRFESQLLSDATEKQRMLHDSLAITRRLARSPAIAATLEELAALAATQGEHAAAIDYYQRALYIRHSLDDSYSSLRILRQLSELYGDDERADKAVRWIEKLEQGELSGWKTMPADFEAGSGE